MTPSPLLKQLLLAACVVANVGCADRILLIPTHEPIVVANAVRREIPIPGRPPIEAFVRCENARPGSEPAAYLLVLDGTGCRAERAVNWGSVVAGDRAVAVWAINYPGYGKSPGRATLASIPPAVLASFDALSDRAGNRPIILWGASLGSTAALYVAAHRPVAGLILSNPPPLRQLIVGRYGWWNLWLLALPVSWGIPDELNSLANAPHVRCPTLIFTADRDRVVPPGYQAKVIDALSGDKRVVHLREGGHDATAASANSSEWSAAMRWFWDRVSDTDIER